MLGILMGDGKTPLQKNCMGKGMGCSGCGGTCPIKGGMGKLRGVGLGDTVDVPFFGSGDGGSGGGGGGFGDSSFWGNLLNFGVRDIAAPILKYQFGQGSKSPMAGQYFASGPGGTVSYALPQGPSTNFGLTPPIGVGSALAGYVPLIVVGGLLVFLMKR